jgi:hypothetical protein
MDGVVEATASDGKLPDHARQVTAFIGIGGPLRTCLFLGDIFARQDRQGGRAKKM